MKASLTRNTAALACAGAIGLCSLLPWPGHAIGAEAAYPRLKLDGPPEVVYESNTLGCKDANGKPVRNDHPDMPARAFRDHTGEVHMLASSRQNFQLTGPTLDQVARRDCDRSVISRNNPAPEAFDHFQWLMSTYTEDGKTVFGLTHHEYHGDLYLPECKKDSKNQTGSWRKRCWYASVNFVISHDGGKSFNPPDGIPKPIAMLPYRFSTDMNRAGLHAPTNIVKNPADNNYYTMVHAAPYGRQPRGMCLLRTTNLNQADWRAWGGEAFDVKFANPYTSQISDIKPHICTPVIPWFARSLTYNTQAKAFLIVGNFPDRAVYAWSSDLVQWSEATTLKETLEFPVAIRNQAPEATAYFSALDPSSSSPSFDQTNLRFYTYYTKFSEPIQRGPRGWFFTKRELIRQPVVIQ